MTDDPDDFYGLFSIDGDTIDDLAAGNWHLEQMDSTSYAFVVDVGDDHTHKFRLDSETPIRVQMYDPDIMPEDDNE